MKYRHDHVHLTTQSVDKWVKWYEEAMGATVTNSVESAGTKFVNMDLGGTPLRISTRTGVEKHLSDQSGKPVLPPEGYHHMGFLVDDIDACVKDLTARGARLEVAVSPASPTLKCGFLMLPGGVRIELCQKL